ncbi:S-layer homology domain-containing protein [Paenibacillus contaminans]|uniref:SLH domain-containing protein n=1 Tax=Paenibacillus contaminans TaxID=450362 RepID=A0A329M2J2_9BACL|nr:S-layer homology domain-containing protein [Paenibacillus contaminans]RAV14415.1 hypothetical protein DQG23_31480 [Paenibacillus contaminans]
MKLRALFLLRAVCVVVITTLLAGSLWSLQVKANEAASYLVHAGVGPHAVAVNTLTGKVYVANVGSDSVTVIGDSEEPGGAAVVATVAVGTAPYALAVNSLTNTIYVANVDDDTVTVIDGATNGTFTIPTGKQPVGVAVNEATNKIYVANMGSDNVTVIDGATHGTVTVAAGRSPFAVAVNGAANKIYVANIDSDTVTVIDGAGNTTTSISTGLGPNALAVDPITGNVYVANFFSNNVTVIDALTSQTTAISAGAAPNAVEINEVTGKIYVANDHDNSVTVIDRTNHSAVTVAVGQGPDGIAVNTETNRIYVANYESGSVTVVNGADHTTSTIAVGESPIAIAANAGIGKVYTANFNSGDVSVIEEERAALPKSAALKALTVSEGSLSPAFQPNIEAYTVQVEHAVAQLVVAAETLDPAASISVTGSVYGNELSLPIDLQVGANEVSIVVQSADELQSQTYRLTIVRLAVDEPGQPARSANAELTQILVSAGTLQPAFTPSVYTYGVDVGNNVTTVSVTASTYDSAAAMQISGQLHGSGVPFVVSLQTGANHVPIIVTAEDGISKSTYMLTVRRAEQVQLPGTPHEEKNEQVVTPSQPQPKPELIVETANGLIVKSEAAAYTVSTAADGTTMLTALLDGDVLTKAFGMLTEKAEDSRNITFTITGTENIRKAGIPANVIKQAAVVPNTVLSIQAGDVAYNLPANLPALAAILEQLGSDADKAVVYVTMATVTGDAAKQVEDQAKMARARVIGPVLDFSLSLQTPDRTITISDFGKTYVTRSILLSRAVDPAKATGLMFDVKSGTLSFVPSVFTATDKDETIVKMLRPGNSLYTVIEFRASFADVREHWAGADIELLASKLIVNGMTDTSFVPGNSVTRAEFVSLLIRALGLQEDAANATQFQDAASHDWFAGALGAAAKVGIVGGFEDNTFRADEAITREQMAVMLLKALRFTGQQNTVIDKPGSALTAFEDRGEISAWAKAAVEQIVQAGIMNGQARDSFAPDHHATRAEAAVVVKRLLQAASFIN